jgi:hypothetical protein
MKKLFIIISSLLFCLTVTSCSEEKVAETPKVNAKGSKADTYKNWHDVCLKGKVDDIDKQIAKFEARLKEDPNDNLAKVYLGSSQALKAKYSKWPLTKLKCLREGEKSLDSAVEQAPDDARVRMVRAIAGYKVPKRFERRPTSLLDFEYLIPIAKDPKGRLKKNECQVILYYAHLAYGEDGRDSAERLKKLCHNLDPNSTYGELTK